MAKIIDILTTERDRQTTDAFNVVHMYKTGQFYTAYDWSAWIISVISYTDAVRNQTKDRHPLTVTRIKMATSDTTFCKVGFPFKSIEKFCPLRQDFEGVENDHITFRIPLPEPTDNSEITFERLRDAVDKWTDQHIRQASLNWTQPCYAMNLDIRGYFMHINRDILLKLATESPNNMAKHKVGLADDVPIPSGVILTKSTTWADIRDMSLILWLTEQIVTLDPMENCIIVGDESDWDGMDHAKCMRYVLPGLGLPIGNLTSQLYSNVYLNPFDQFVKRDILCEHYGRYVDDSAMIDACREWLLAQVPKVREFLADELGLQLHMGKLHVREVCQGVEFLGAFVKPYRDYISNKTLERITRNIQTMDMRDVQHVEASINSYLGVLSHSSSYNIKCELFEDIDGDWLLTA